HTRLFGERRAPKIRIRRRAGGRHHSQRPAGQTGLGDRTAGPRRHRPSDHRVAKFVAADRSRARPRVAALARAPENGARNRAREPGPSGTGLPFVFAVGGAAILLGYLVIHSLGSAKSEPESAAPAPPVAASQPPVLAKKRRVMPPVVRASPFPDVVVVTTNPPALPQPDPMPAPAQPHAPGSAGVAQDLVARLARPDLFAGGVTPQKVEELKGSFKQLAEQGGASVPAIREFLDRFQDIDFDAVGAGKQVGYPSLRIGLLNVLGQIGEPEAAELSLQTLQKTGDPLEIALLAKGLEKQLPPEQFREAALTAASQALA